MSVSSYIFVCLGIWVGFGGLNFFVRILTFSWERGLQTMGWFKKSPPLLNPHLLTEPLAHFSVIELKILRDVMCDSYNEVEVNYKIVFSKEMQDYNLQLFVGSI